MAFPRRSLFPVGPGEDPYSALLSGTRAIHREHRVLRESWLEELSLEVHIGDANELAQSAAPLARAEGFELHARSMEARIRENDPR